MTKLKKLLLLTLLISGAVFGNRLYASCTVSFTSYSDTNSYYYSYCHPQFINLVYSYPDSMGVGIQGFMDFGDGTTSEYLTYYHDYPATGTYYCCVTLFEVDYMTSPYDTICSYTFCDSVVVEDVFNANFYSYSRTTDSSLHIYPFLAMPCAGSGTEAIFYSIDGVMNGPYTRWDYPVLHVDDWGYHDVCMFAYDTIYDTSGSVSNLFYDTNCQRIFFGDTFDYCGFYPGADLILTYEALSPGVAYFYNYSTLYGSPSNFHWDFGDGTDSTVYGYMTHTYPSPGIYTVCVEYESISIDPITLNYDTCRDYECFTVNVTDTLRLCDSTSFSVNANLVGDSIYLTANASFRHGDTLAWNSWYECAAPYTGWWAMESTAVYPAHAGINSISYYGGSYFGCYVDTCINLIAIDSGQNLEVSINRLTPPIIGRSLPLNLMMGNGGSVTMTNVYCDLFYDENQIYVGSSITPFNVDLSNHVITYFFDSLVSAELQIATIDFLTPTTDTVGMLIHDSAYISPYVSDLSPANNIAINNSIVISSLDPNEMRVFPTGSGEDGDIDINTALLHYQVLFQNVGTGSVENVIIRDVFESDLDPSSLQITNASHTFTHELIGNELVIYFYGIHLPDSTTDEPNSHGIVEFDISIRPGLAEGTEIFNNAQIYFDFNPALVTNTVKNTLKTMSGSTQIPAAATNLFEEALAYPVPTKESLWVRLGSWSEAKFALYDMIGSTVKSGSFESKVNQLDISNLPDGLYILQLHNDGFTQSLRIEKF